MSQTRTPVELLIVAIQDLHDGEIAWGERLAELREAVPASILSFVPDELARSAAQAFRLEALAEILGAPAQKMENIWLRAILDDAKRDSETIVEGPLRAIALVGAFRKGKQSERVSYETAIGLSRQLGHDEAVAVLTLSRDEEAAADADLARLLDELLQTIS
jgi:ferritin-like metal-binding protein YciE